MNRQPRSCEVFSGNYTVSGECRAVRNASLNLTKAEGDQGRAVRSIRSDPTGETIPNTSPLYAVENSAGHIAKTLTDVGANAGFGQHGFRKTKAGGAPGFDSSSATPSLRSGSRASAGCSPCGGMSIPRRLLRSFPQ